MKNRSTLKEVVPEIARIVARLGPGPAAELRRGPTSGAGAAAYWHIAAEYDLRSSDDIMPKFVQIVAILTPRGNIDESPFFSAHKAGIPMGRALFNAGIREFRLSRFLDTPKLMRPDSAVRICRRLARSEHAQFNLLSLAYFLYDTGNVAQEIAREYYKAKYSSNQSSENKTK